MATRTKRQPSSKYRIICDQCHGHGFYLPAWAKSWESAEDCATCNGIGELCQHCAKPVPQDEPHGCVGPADPCDVLAIVGYYANLPRYEVDEVWTRNGKTYCQISERMRCAECPPDAEIQRYEVVERNINGSDVEVVQFATIGHVNGVTGKTEWYDDSEQAYEGDR